MVAPLFFVRINIKKIIKLKIQKLLIKKSEKSFLRRRCINSMSLHLYRGIRGGCLIKCGDRYEKKDFQDNVRDIVPGGNHLVSGHDDVM